MEEAIAECAGWLCTLGCESGCSTTRKRASNPGTVQDTCTPRHWKDEKVGKLGLEDPGSNTEDTLVPYVPIDSAVTSEILTLHVYY